MGPASAAKTFTMQKNIYIATVQIAVVADSVAEACDAISECLSENLQRVGAIVDWSYLSDGKGEYVQPVDKGAIEMPIEEGELFK